MFQLCFCIQINWKAVFTWIKWSTGKNLFLIVINEFSFLLKGGMSSYLPPNATWHFSNLFVLLHKLYDDWGYMWLCSRCSVTPTPILLQIQKQLGCLVKTSGSTTGEWGKLWSRAGQQTNLAAMAGQSESGFWRHAISSMSFKNCPVILSTLILYPWLLS